MNEETKRKLDSFEKRTCELLYENLSKVNNVDIKKVSYECCGNSETILLNTSSTVVGSLTSDKLRMVYNKEEKVIILKLVNANYKKIIYVYNEFEHEIYEDMLEVFKHLKVVRKESEFDIIKNITNNIIESFSGSEK